MLSKDGPHTVLTTLQNGIRHSKIKCFLTWKHRQIFFSKYAFLEYRQKIYNWLTNAKIFGMFDFWHPLVIVLDPKLLKQLASENFRTFLKLLFCFELPCFVFSGEQVIFPDLNATSKYGY